MPVLWRIYPEFFSGTKETSWDTRDWLSRNGWSTPAENVRTNLAAAYQGLALGFAAEVGFWFLNKIFQFLVLLFEQKSSLLGFVAKWTVHCSRNMESSSRFWVMIVVKVTTWHYEHILITLWLKVPITPKMFFRRDESLSHVEQNGAKIFAFGKNWNFLWIFKVTKNRGLKTHYRAAEFAKRVWVECNFWRNTRTSVAVVKSFEAIN